MFGDIGTSPLYALRECFYGPFGVDPTRANVLGVLSLIFWALVLVISIKYLVLVLRADNRGEGGTMALLALVRQSAAARTAGRGALLMVVGLFGAALLYGDGVITPAISVLSAVEGLTVATDAFEPYVLPAVVVVLVGLFSAQRYGTARMGGVFGPIILVWFAVLAILGLRGILREPGVLQAIVPTHAFDFFVGNGMAGFVILSAVFLVVTGGEALYVDMGHFGPRPIRWTWTCIVLPALLLNYFGQGALVLDGTVVGNPFYELAPRWGLYPLVALATAATVIASQAIITGAFSLTRQAINLGYMPRLEVRHTSSSMIGQIYIPPVNWALMIGTIWLVLEFKTSSSLAAAYGVAISTEMVITTILLFFVARGAWGWSAPLAAAVTGALLIVDLAFFGATITKVAHGGWVPLVIGLGVFTLMTTWRRGRLLLMQRLQASKQSLAAFLGQVGERPPARVAGTAMFLTADLVSTPTALTQNLKHNRMLHKLVILLNIQTTDAARVREEDRLEVTDLGLGFYCAVARYGFMESPNVGALTQRLAAHGLPIDEETTTYFLGRERIVPSPDSNAMSLWRERLFAFMARNAQEATTYFRVPPDRVIEVGSQVKL